MAGTTSKLGLIKPSGSEDANIEVINQNMDTIDANIGVNVVTSSTMPSSPFQGQMVLQSDTGLVFQRIGSSWQLVARLGNGTAGSSPIHRVSNSTDRTDLYNALSGTNGRNGFFVQDDGDVYYTVGSGWRRLATEAMIDDRYTSGGGSMSNNSNWTGSIDFSYVQVGSRRHVDIRVDIQRSSSQSSASGWIAIQNSTQLHTACRRSQDAYGFAFQDVSPGPGDDRMFAIRAAMSPTWAIQLFVGSDGMPANTRVKAELSYGFSV